MAAALRETQEEVGIAPASIDVVASLPSLFLAPSSNAVTPVLAHWLSPRPLTPADPAEVARVAFVAVTDLLDPANRFMAVHPLRPGMRLPGFEVDSLFIWGFTAMLLSTLFDIAGLTRDWDRAREIVVPERLIDPGLAR